MEPLEGLRVVEFAIAIQGPLAGGFLADMGADVIKVEPPGGDPNRWFPGVNWPHGRQTPGSQFLSVSHGKRSIALDIHTELGRDALFRLVDRADIFLSNFREDSLIRLGLGYEDLAQRNERLIYAVANGFGHEGPDRDKRMTDQYAQARSGIAGVTGEPGSPMLIPGAVIGDTSGAMGLALGIMTALAARQLHGIGQRVRSSSYGVMVWMQGWELNHSSITGQLLQRDGPHHPNVPGIVGIYETADGGAFCVGVGSDDAWREFCQFGGIPELADDARWDSFEKRSPMQDIQWVEHSRQLRPDFARAMRNRTTAEWEDFFDQRRDDIMYQRVFDYEDVMADPQALENGYIVEKDVPGVGPRKMAGQPLQFSATPASAKPWFADLGQHTAEIMNELGFTREQIAQVEAQKNPQQPMSRRAQTRTR